MSRLIDADRLKAEIFKACMDSHFMPTKLLDCDDVTELIDNVPTVDTTFREVVAYECGQKSVGKWIPVTERLPEEDEDMLVTYIGDAGYSFIEMVWFNEGKFLSQDGEFEISNVVAWMPLPEPYKRGGEEYDTEQTER